MGTYGNLTGILVVMMFDGIYHESIVVDLLVALVMGALMGFIVVIFRIYLWDLY